jgi:aspartyl/asparaginyl beta-hydroxylase (cupin superfamily)
MRAVKGSLAYRVASATGLFVRNRVEWAIARSAPDRPWFEADEFDWVPAVEARTAEIHRELDEVLRGPIPEFREVSPEQARIVEGAPWKTYIFFVYGREYEKNTRACPVTASVLRGIPGMTSGFFSILEPGARLTEHRGPYKGVLRYHLALKVPRRPEQCGIKVGGEVRHWIEGRSLVFDDTYEHSAWNESDQTRVVLFVDFIRRMTGPLAVVNQALLALFRVSPFVQNMFEKLDQVGRALPGAKR